MSLRICLVVPHIFMHEAILPQVIFSPGALALQLADNLVELGHEVTLMTPGPVTTKAHNITADLSYFERELDGRGDTYISLLKKHPFTFVTMARQVQSEIVAAAYAGANDDQFDIVHIYTNEEDIALPFARLCTKPVVFTHHDPFNFMVKYKQNFPKYKQLNWISISDAQRASMPADTNWVGTVHHGIDVPALSPVRDPTDDYLAYIGRIIKPKGVHLAIQALHEYNKDAKRPLKLKIAGKHYAEASKDSYWHTHIEPALQDGLIEFVGFIKSDIDKREFLGNAKALLVPSLFDEPFGIVTLEAFACGTPVIGLDSGALPEIIEDGGTGFIVKKVMQRKQLNDTLTATAIADAIDKVDTLSREDCWHAYKSKFTAKHMAGEHERIYETLVQGSEQ